jgi:nucleoside-triphosphatase THEP1
LPETAHVQPRGLIYVVTGERGTGKSTACAAVVRKVAEAGVPVAGILTERVEEGQGSARRVVDLATGASRPFGSQNRSRGQGGQRSPTSAEGASTPAITDPLTPGWEYESEVFTWVNAILSRSTPCDLLVIDEIGPLELHGGRGWAGALEVLRSRNFRVALVVCRPGLLEDLEKCLGNAPGAVFEVSLQNRDALPGVIAAEVIRLVTPG